MVSVLLDPRPGMPPDLAAAIDVLHNAGLIAAPHLALVEDQAAGLPSARLRSLQRRAG